MDRANPSSSKGQAKKKIRPRVLNPQQQSGSMQPPSYTNYPFHPPSPGMPVQIDYGRFVLPDSNVFSQQHVREQQYTSYHEDNVHQHYQNQAANDDDDDDNDDEDDNEAVPETQPQATQNVSGRSKAARVNWSSNEEAALAKAWLNISEDKVIGNAQKSSRFWARVLDHFNKQFPRPTHRTVDQVNSKWNKMLTKVNNFNGLYQQMNLSRASGSSDADLIKNAQTQYKRLYEKKGFSNMEAWSIMKDHIKWAPVERVGGQFEESSSKRTKNNESGQYSTSNESPAFDMPDLNENNNPSPPTRKGKKSAESSSSTSLVDELRNFNLIKEKKLDRDDSFKLAKIERERSFKVAMDKIADQIDTENFNRDVEIFTAPHDHLTGTFLQIKLAQKRKIAEIRGWVCDF